MGAEKDWELLADEFGELGFALERPPKWKFVVWTRDPYVEGGEFMWGFTSIAQARAKLAELKAEIKGEVCDDAGEVGDVL